MNWGTAWSVSNTRGRIQCGAFRILEGGYSVERFEY